MPLREEKKNPIWLHFETRISQRLVCQSDSNLICSIVEMGIDCILISERFFQTSICYGNQKFLLIYNGETGVYNFFPAIFDWIFFKLAGNQNVHKVSNKNLSISQIRLVALELCALESSYVPLSHEKIPTWL